MRVIVPDYYKEFSCIAGDCRHSCCIGWEIDIDEESMARFDAMDTPYGDTLRARIDRSEEVPHYRLGEGERCPFLRAERSHVQLDLNALFGIVFYQDLLLACIARHDPFQSIKQVRQRLFTARLKNKISCRSIISDLSCGQRCGCHCKHTYYKHQYTYKSLHH